MQTIKFLKAADGYDAGDITTVENNAAHRLIELGIARLHNGFEEQEDRMVLGRAHKMKVKVKRG